MNADQIRDVVKYLLAGYPAQRAKMTPEDGRAMYAFYAAGLVDLDHDAAIAAIDRLSKTAVFMPTVAEIRAAVGVVHHGEQQPAALAWGEVHHFMRTKGSWRTPGVDFKFSDPITAEIVRAFGWEDICASTNQDHLRARFIDAYKQIAKDQRTEAALSPGATNPQLGAPRSRARIYGASSLAQLVAAVKPVDDEGDEP